MSQERLGRDVFIALAAIGWADGKLDEEEADAIVRTAVEEGLAIEEIEEIESATKSPVDIGVIDRSSMTKADRLFVYAVAAWMTRLDGTRDDKEIEALDKRFGRADPRQRGYREPPPTPSPAGGSRGRAGPAAGRPAPAAAPRRRAP